MDDQLQANKGPHQEAEELLPWYATGQLDPAESRRVELHLLSCPECRQQLAFEHRMVARFAELTPEIDSGWQRLQNRLEQSDGIAARAEWWRELTRHAAATWQSLARPPVAALALAQLAFVVLAASVLLSLSRPSYRALGSAPPPQGANVIAIFRPETTESQLHALLDRNAASLVGGPTSSDAYLLRVPSRSRQGVLARLRADRNVIMAQPIDGATS